MLTNRRWWFGLLCGVALCAAAWAGLAAVPPPAPEAPPPPVATPAPPAVALAPPPAPAPPVVVTPAATYPRDLGGEAVRRRLILGELPPLPLPEPTTAPRPRDTPLDRGEVPPPPADVAVPPLPPPVPVAARPSPPQEPLPAEMGPPALGRLKELEMKPRGEKR